MARCPYPQVQSIIKRVYMTFGKQCGFRLKLKTHEFGFWNTDQFFGIFT